MKIICNCIKFNLLLVFFVNLIACNNETSESKLKINSNTTPFHHKFTFKNCCDSGVKIYLDSLSYDLCDLLNEDSVKYTNTLYLESKGEIIVSDKIRNYKHLECIFIYADSINYLSEELFNLPFLCKLEIEGKSRKNTKNISSAKRLKTLYWNIEMLEQDSLPSEIYDLDSLEWLHIGKHIKYLDYEKLIRMKNLKVINVIGSKFIIDQFEIMKNDTSMIEKIYWNAPWIDIVTAI